MADSPDPQRPRWRTVPLWGWAVVAVSSAVVFWVAMTNGGGGGNHSLPPGFTISTGEDSGVDRSGELSTRGSASIESLMAGTGMEEMDRFEASIAILPLVNRTGDTVFDTLGDGMTEDLIARLSRIRGLKVISQQSVGELEGLDLSASQVGDTLGVGHLLRGIAFLDQDAARIQVSLVQVDGETELWRNDYSVDRTNRMRAVEEISNEVSAALLEQVPTLSLRGSSGANDSPGFVTYLAGNRLLGTRTRDGVVRAIDAFKTAIELDSTLAPAYAGLSSAYALSITYRYDIGVDGYSAAGLALSAAGEAVRLDPELAEGYAARGYISSVALAPTQMVLEDFTRARDLQPNAPNVPAWSANLLVREGYFDQALAEAARAVDLDPLSPARRTGWAYEALGAKDYGLAIDQAEMARSYGEEVILPRAIQALALLLSGRAEECLDVPLGPHAGIRAICLHDLGRVDRAEAITDSLRATLQAGIQAHPDFTNVIPAGDLAAYLAWTGSPDRALAWIHRAYALSPSGIDPRVLESGIFAELMSNTSMRREVAELRDRIWTRVQGELVEADAEMGRRDDRN